MEEITTNEQEPVFAEEQTQKFDWVKWGARVLFYVSVCWGIPLLPTLEGGDFMRNVLTMHVVASVLISIVAMVWLGFSDDRK